MSDLHCFWGFELWVPVLPSFVAGWAACLVVELYQLKRGKP